ncbi:breast carcinoma-amplified sequence 1 isoform X1 [Canis lupus familiaris]|uniref:breast carcinoma-amplified sequence 1 isoform X1 n=1 Tax=Canis lupus familiaris TaxID=9615 RepID=UPI00004BE226|nr:breast carcinoma-amplified sequence 1 isoform X1 [Canis lupus familiaris]XP_038428553.1 breast carcinoma-amplified sequence 1 isoform X1 [Canis lupus familiaris]|eukprot:XP_022264629.1 breast carcinoma-amplified sequence 1 isoform X2 [Canis lupus familiaris]
MGNEMSVPKRVEDQENESETDANKVASENKCGQNGTPVILSTHDITFYDEVDLGISVKEDNVATSSPKTMEISAVADANGKNLGKEAKPEAPAAKSRFFLTLSRPVPGRTGDQATDSSTGAVKLDVSSNKALGNKEPTESMALPVAAAPGHDPDKTPGQSPAGDQGSSATWGPAPVSPESGGAAPSKPKDSSFLDKLFKLDKGREKAPVDSQQEAKSSERRDQAEEISGLSRPSDDVPAERDIAGSKGREEQEIPTVSGSVPGNPEERDPAKEDLQTTNTTENNNSIMSFFKTLVSPNKAETKKDLEDTGAEKSPATSSDIKSDKANFISQETRGAAKNPTSTDTAKEAAKEKGGPTSLPLGKLFWKKSVKEDSVPAGAEENVVCESPVEVVKSEEVESALQTVDLNEEGDATPEPTEVKLKREEYKPPRTSLMAFLRQMSVKGDGGITHSEEKGKDSSHQTSDSAEKAVTCPEPEPAGAGQKGKEGSSKDKKVVAEGNKQKSTKQEAKEPVQCVEPAVVEANSLQNGDRSQKKQEKRRQSLGGFFKGLGPKRMLDAQVQTDPVSIGPVGKSK